MRPTNVFWKNLSAFGKYDIIINKGGTWSSKTVSIGQVVHQILDRSQRHLKASLVSQSYDHLREGAVYDLIQTFEREGFDIEGIHNESKKTFHFNKSVLKYFSTDKGKATGPKRDILWLNEPNKGITYETWLQLWQRTKICAFIEYNPSEPWWINKPEIIEDPRTLVIHSTFKDNYQNLPDKQRRFMLKAYLLSKTDPYWAYWWKVYGEGIDAVLLEERIMPFLKRVSRVPDDAVEVPTGLDFGFFPHPTACCRIWCRKGLLKDDLFIQQLIYDQKLSINSRESEVSETGTKNLCDLLEQKGHDKNHLIIAESADSRAVNDMREAGFAIEKVKKKSVEITIRLFHEYNIHILEGSDDVWNEFDNYKYKRDKRTNEILQVPAEGQADHFIDAVRYVLMSRGRRGWS